MKTLKWLALGVSISLLAGPGSRTIRGAAGTPLLGILKSELQRNLEVLKKEPTPPYFASYAVHDARTTTIRASFGALQRSEEDRSRFASVEVHVGDYSLDNTHPIRGDFSASLPRVS